MTMLPLTSLLPLMLLLPLVRPPLASIAANNS
jgi:hypothetical protein